MNGKRSIGSRGALTAASIRVGAAVGGATGTVLAAAVVVLTAVYLGAMCWAVFADSGDALLLVLWLVPLTIVLLGLMPWVCGGYRLLGEDAPAASIPGTVWHATSQDWAVGDAVVLEQARCRPTARMLRSDRPLTRSQNAVYVFIESPTTHHVNGNVRRNRARYLYTLEVNSCTGLAYRRGAALAIAGDIEVTVTDREDRFPDKRPS